MKLILVTFADEPPKIFQSKSTPPKNSFHQSTPQNFNSTNLSHLKFGQISTNQCQTHRYIYLQIYHKASHPWIDKYTKESSHGSIWICQVKASMSKINEELHRDETSPPLHLGVKSSTSCYEQTNKTLGKKYRL